VTRAAEQADALSELLEERGAVPVVCPTIEVVAPEDPAPLDRTLERLGTYDWVIFTSANGVRFVVDRLAAAGHDVGALFAGVKVAAIGPATAEAARERGLGVDLLPKEYVAEAVFDALGPTGVKGRRFLLPRAAEARDVLPRAVRDAGGHIDVVTAYVTRAPQGAGEQLAAALAEGPLDAALFTSSSTVQHFARLVGGEVEARRVLSDAVVACIGPVAAATARRLGLEVRVVADPYTVPALVDALEAFWHKP
jgi:uroporphyrinogen III methyltransferase/synthase